MSSNTPAPLSRRLCLSGLVASGALSLAGGCGFTPALGSQGASRALYGAVAVTAPDTVFGYAMRQQLSNRLGAVTTTPRFVLDLKLSQSRKGASVNDDGDTTRFHINGTARWTLTETATGQTFDGRTRAFTGYATTGSTVATQTARADAPGKLAVRLADQVTAQVTIAVGET